jgi:DNA-binding MarR family transcriptional regulator
MFKDRAAALVMDLEGVADGVRARVVLFRTLTALAGQLRARMDARYRDAGVTTQQAAVLALASVGAPPTQGEVARLLGVTQQNVRQIVDALVRKGLIEVRAQDGDRRMKRLVPTRRVGRLFARRNAGDFAAVAGWFSVLDDATVEALVDGLGRVLAALGAADREDAAPLSAAPAGRSASRAARTAAAGRRGARR